MFDLFDLASPRVYVVSEKRYEEMLTEKRQRERQRLEQRRDAYLELVAKLEQEIKALA
jgi:PHD/YefM family antitoxin component YafN of YafNO toxin-antitoxin module